VRAVRVTVVSDIHLSAAAPVAQANWEAVVRHIAADAPDIVLHLGDLTRDGANGRRDLDHGRRQLDRLPVPWHAVPGNHDVGDNPSVDTPAAAAADDDRLPALDRPDGRRPLVADGRRLDAAGGQRTALRLRPGG